VLETAPQRIAQPPLAVAVDQLVFGRQQGGVRLLVAEVLFFERFPVGGGQLVQQVTDRAVLVTVHHWRPSSLVGGGAGRDVSGAPMHFRTQASRRKRSRCSRMRKVAWLTPSWAARRRRSSILDAPSPR
jgi:hypothetical protein